MRTAALVLSGLLLGACTREAPIEHVTVTSVLPGANASEVDASLTRVMENELLGAPGLIDENAESREGVSIVVLTMTGDDPAATIRDRLSRASAALPANAEPPLIMRADPDEEPLLTLAVTGAEGSIAELTARAVEPLRTRIERLPGIAGVRTPGERPLETLVRVDREKLAAANLTVEDLLASQILSTSFLVRTAPASPDELGKTVLGGHEPLRLMDIASVERAAAPASAVAERDGVPAILVEVLAQRGADREKTAARVREAIAPIASSPGWAANVLPRAASFELSSAPGSKLEETARAAYALEAEARRLPGVSSVTVVVRETRVSLRVVAAGITRGAIRGIASNAGLQLDPGGASMRRVRLSGQDPAIVRSAASELARSLGAGPGVEAISLEPRGEAPEIRIDIDRERAAMVGAGAGAIAVAARASFDRVPIRDASLTLARPESAEYYPDLAGIDVRGADGRLVPLASLVTVRREAAPESITRHLGGIVTRLAFEAESRAPLDRALAARPLPAGVAVEEENTPSAPRIPDAARTLALLASLALSATITIAAIIVWVWIRRARNTRGAPVPKW